MEAGRPSNGDHDNSSPGLKRKLDDKDTTPDASDIMSSLKQQRCGSPESPVIIEGPVIVESPIIVEESDILDSDSLKATKTEEMSISQPEIDLTIPVEAIETSQSSQQPLPDPLSYTKAEEFTSEIFKIQLHNMPQFGFNQLKKRLTSLGLKPHKLKSPNRNVTYVCFKNEDDKKEALQKLDGHVWKGRTLEAKEAAPVEDPYLKKRQAAARNSESDFVTKDIPENQPLSHEEAQEKLRKLVMPLWNTEYCKQLEMKTAKMKQVLVKIPKHPSVKDQFRQRQGWRFGDMACDLLPIVASPLTSDYRNKNEFTVGYGLDGKTIGVGFRYGLYKDGTTAIGEPHNMGNMMAPALPVAESFQKFAAKSKWSPYLQQTGAGHWQTLTVRTFLSGDVMAMIDFVPRKLEKTEIDEAKTSVKEFYTTGDGKDVMITSFYFRIVGKEHKLADSSERLQHIFGEHHVHETLLGLKFRISPEAFFQVNTRAAECLYSLVGKWCGITETTTVLDICCGTGTIGLSMAKRAKEMIGIEMCKPAIEDANANATFNGITNATFHCAKVEDVIGRIISSLGLNSSSRSPPSSPSPSSSSLPNSPHGDLVAVVDPPRAGLHKNVIKTLRKAREIERLIYVSCNADSAMENFLDLIRPSTGKHKGMPFTLVKAVPVDLFPGTMHCELVLLFTRGENAQAVTPDA